MAQITEKKGLILFPMMLLIIHSGTVLGALPSPMALCEPSGNQGERDGPLRPFITQLVPWCLQTSEYRVTVPGRLCVFVPPD